MDATANRETFSAYAPSKSRIQHLMAYVDAAHELVRFARRSDIALRPLRSVMSCAGTLTDGMNG